ncbi:LAME_0E02894g1_1 [Lachancea meyersii CBS 8951]|uniref:LAME_0E02894g1_1 n=1 Tax=Lachancea meyersii CBS 8951 TaxID=1266667 RepID=A0A1G4JGQ1_9SACH|nr:LAME_0E02894g1_1 [Lachancea meyersii CBS 8951]
MSIVIHNGTHTTIAGFSQVDMPQLLCSSSYTKRPDGSLDFDTDEILNGPETPIFTIMSTDGTPYDWEALEKQWKWIVETKLGAKLEETPLVVTVAPDITKETKNQYLELALGRLKVPVFQMVLEPLAVSLSLGRNTALVVDIGAAKTTVTPVIEGTILSSAAIRSRFAGDFLDFQVYETLKKRAFPEEEESSSACPSFTAWHNSHTWIQEFKAYMLQASPSKLQEMDSATADILGLNVVKNFLYKKHKTVTLTQKDCCSITEGIFQPSTASSQFSNEEGLSNIVAKAVKKAGASTAQSASAANVTSAEQIHTALLTNIIITGSSSLIAGLEQRVVNDLSYQFPQYKLSSFANPLVLDRKLQSWHGGVTMANLPSWDLGDWVSRKDFQSSADDEQY